MFNRVTIFPLLIFMFFTVQTNGQKTSGTAMEWKVVAELPAINGARKALGLAGPVVGVIKDKLIIAGGANFPEGMPWTGGKKKYHDDIYILEAGKNGDYTWMTPATPELPANLAYSGNLSLPEGIICIGGETDTGYTRNVFKLQWDDEANDLKREKLPALPVALANAAVTHIRRSIYVAGGENAASAMNSFFRLNLDAANPCWETLPPLPIAMSHGVAVAQSNGVRTGIFVIGGRRKSYNSLSALYRTVYFFDPVANSWTEVSKINNGEKDTPISAGTAVAIGDHSIVLIGGDEGDIFHQIEFFNLSIEAAVTDEAKASLQEKKLKLLLNHPGFSSKILLYNTLDHTWKKIDEMPFRCPVTTTAVCWNGRICIPGGEVQPGRRTPSILMGTFKSKSGKMKK
jgi:N-acetylneuraminate epimerase